MVDAGVDLMELQIPFSEPMADGPVILKANQAASGPWRHRKIVLSLPKGVGQAFRSVHAFASRMSEIGIKGAIVPDFPPEEADDYLVSHACKYHSLCVYLFLRRHRSSVCR